MVFKLSKGQHQTMVEEIQRFFLNERGEELSEFAAENLLDFFKESLAPHFYNNAVNDAIHVIEQQYFSFEEEIRTLERPVKK